jgi:UPF0271 protein
MRKGVMSDHGLRVDINSDMGEGFGAYKLGDDAAILDIVSSANVACGFHAGDPEIMAATFSMARERGVAVGAHPSFADLWGFGRRVIPHSAGEIERLVTYQIGAAQALSAYAGHPIRYVKAHGALGNLTQTDRGVAEAVTRAVKAVDRAYTEEGFLVSRKLEGAVIHDAEQAAERVVRMVRQGAIETVSGQMLKTPIDSICVHSDTPAAVAIAARVRRRLEENGVSVRAFAAMA